MNASHKCRLSSSSKPFRRKGDWCERGLEEERRARERNDESRVDAEEPIRRFEISPALECITIRGRACLRLLVIFVEFISLDRREESRRHFVELNLVDRGAAIESDPHETFIEGVRPSHIPRRTRIKGMIDRYPVAGVCTTSERANARE